MLQEIFSIEKPCRSAAGWGENGEAARAVSDWILIPSWEPRKWMMNRHQ